MGLNTNGGNVTAEIKPVAGKGSMATPKRLVGGNFGAGGDGAEGEREWCWTQNSARSEEVSEPLSYAIAPMASGNIYSLLSRVTPALEVPYIVTEGSELIQKGTVRVRFASSSSLFTNNLETTGNYISFKVEPYLTRPELLATRRGAQVSIERSIFENSSILSEFVNVTSRADGWSVSNIERGVPKSHLQQSLARLVGVRDNHILLLSRLVSLLNISVLLESSAFTVEYNSSNILPRPYTHDNFFTGATRDTSRMINLLTMDSKATGIIRLAASSDPFRFLSCTNASICLKDYWAIDPSVRFSTVTAEELPVHDCNAFIQAYFNSQNVAAAIDSYASRIGVTEDTWYLVRAFMLRWQMCENPTFALPDPIHAADLKALITVAEINTPSVTIV